MKKKLPGLVNNAGFSLVEVMVAAGVLGVVTMGSMQLMNTMSDGQRRMWQMLNLTDAIAEVQNAVRNQETCRATLNPAGPPILISTTGGASNFTVLRRADGTALVTAPTEYGTGAGRIRVDVFQLTSTGPNNVGQAKTASVVLRYRKREGAVWGAQLVRDIPIKVIPTAANRVSRCYLSDMSGPACDALGGDFDELTGRCTTIDLSLQAGADLRLPADGEICRGGVCQTVFNSNQTCPWGSMNARCVNVVGISPGGTLMCGAAPAGTACTP